MFKTLLALVTVYSFLGPYKALGQTLKSNPCPNPTDTYNLVKLTIPALTNMDRATHTLDCSSENDIFVLLQKLQLDTYPSRKTGEYTIVNRVPKGSPAHFLFMTSPMDSDRRTEGRQSIDATHEVAESVFSFFVDKAKSPKCRAKYEMAFIRAKGVQDKLVIEEPVYSGVCIEKEFVSQNTQLPMPLTVLDLLDYPRRQFFGPPVQTKGIQVIYYLNGTGLPDSDRLLHLVDINLESNAVHLQVSLTAQDALANADDNYFMTARILPDSNKLALFYTDPQVVLLDYSNGIDKLQLTEVYREKKEGIGTTSPLRQAPHYGSLRASTTGGWMVLFDNFEKRFRFLTFSLADGGFVLKKFDY